MPEPEPPEKRTRFLLAPRASTDETKRRIRKMRAARRRMHRPDLRIARVAAEGGGAPRHASILLVLRAFHADLAAEFGFDEGVDVAVHGGLDVVGFLAGAEVEHFLIGLEDVRANLIAP